MVIKMPLFNKQQAYCFDTSFFHLLICLRWIYVFRWIPPSGHLLECFAAHHPSSGVYALMSVHQPPLHNRILPQGSIILHMYGTIHN